MQVARRQAMAQEIAPPASNSSPQTPLSEWVTIVINTLTPLAESGRSIPPGILSAARVLEQVRRQAADIDSRHYVTQEVLHGQSRVPVTQPEPQIIPETQSQPQQEPELWIPSTPLTEPSQTPLSQQKRKRRHLSRPPHRNAKCPYQKEIQR
jgi:hypothetical protein